MESRKHPDAQHIAHNLALEAELLRLLDAFDADGIAVIVLKGVPLARRLFRGVAHRKILDNDLLVHRADVARAHAALERLGYRSPPFRPLATDLGVSFEHAMARTDPNGKIFHAELHWHAFAAELFDVSEALLWQRSVLVSFNGRLIRVFDEALTLLHLVSHFIQHGCLQPRILADFAAAWMTHSDSLDATELLRLAERTRTRDALIYTIRMSLELGLLEHAPLAAPSVRARVLSRLVPSMLVRRGGKVLAYWTTPAIWACLAPLQLPRLLTSLAFPPLSVMSSIYQQPRTLWLLPRYATRLFRPLGRVLSGT